MIESKLVIDIITATLAGEQHEEQIKKQLNFLEEVEYEHTGSGLLVFIENRKGVSQFRLSDDQQKELFGESDHELNTVEVINDQLGIRAETLVHFTNGTIDRVEIWNTLGGYPEDDLETWKLARINN